MSEVAFQLSQDELNAYQYAVRDRIQERMRRASKKSLLGRWLLLMGTALIATFAMASAIDHFLDRIFEPPEFFFGLVLGFGAMLAATWFSYLDQRQGMARADGPILSSQTFRLTPEGTAFQSKLCDVCYRWEAVTDITEARGLVIFWVEPGAGMAIPAGAFASAAARSAFIAEAEALRAAAAAA